jgi:hypothetical protein
MGGLFEIRLIMMFAIELEVATIIACANLFIKVKLEPITNCKATQLNCRDRIQLRRS